jgi:hypothetical protein
LALSLSFDASLTKYRKFLGKNGYSPNTVWITPHDVLVCDRPLVYVKMPVPEENEESAQRLFEFGISEKKGVLFETVCASIDTTFIQAWVPRDDSEAEQYQMPRDLKMSAVVGASRLPARIVESRWLWWLLGHRDRKLQSLKHQLFLQETNL